MLNNAHYKSTLVAYNTNTQAVTATPNALTFEGTVVQSTGIAIDVNGNTAVVSYPGTYELKASCVVDAATAGDITVGLYLNDAVLPETQKVITCAAGNTEIDLNTIRTICTEPWSNASIQMKLTGDGTIVGNVINTEIIMEKLR